MAGLTVLDASVLTAYFDPEDAHGHAANASGADSIATFDKPLKKAAAERGL